MANLPEAIRPMADEYCIVWVMHGGMPVSLELPLFTVDDVIRDILCGSIEDVLCVHKIKVGQPTEDVTEHICEAIAEDSFENQWEPEGSIAILLSRYRVDHFVTAITRYNASLHARMYS